MPISSLNQNNMELSINELNAMANRFIQLLIDNGWQLTSYEQITLSDAYINSLLSEL
jgi:hypothetical protein